MFHFIYFGVRWFADHDFNNFLKCFLNLTRHLFTYFEVFISKKLRWTFMMTLKRSKSGFVIKIIRASDEKLKHTYDCFTSIKILSFDFRLILFQGWIIFKCRYLTKGIDNIIIHHYSFIIAVSVLLRKSAKKYFLFNTLYHDSFKEKWTEIATIMVCNICCAKINVFL